MKTQDALRLAQERDLDLVEVAADAKPPVCRILDYSKYKYEQVQKQKAARKHQTQINVREIKFRPKIAQHDYDTKKGHVIRFLKSRDKVKVTIMFRGREMAHPERGEMILNRLAEDLGELAVIEQRPQQDGRNMTMMLAPTQGGAGGRRPPSRRRRRPSRPPRSRAPQPQQQPGRLGPPGRGPARQDLAPRRSGRGGCVKAPSAPRASSASSSARLVDGPRVHVQAARVGGLDQRRVDAALRAGRSRTRTGGRRRAARGSPPSRGRAEQLDQRQPRVGGVDPVQAGGRERLDQHLAALLAGSIRPCSREQREQPLLHAVGGLGRLRLDVVAGAVPVAAEDRVERGDPLAGEARVEPRADVDLAQLGQRVLVDAARPAGGALRASRRAWRRARRPRSAGGPARCSRRPSRAPGRRPRRCARARGRMRRGGRSRRRARVRAASSAAA